MIAYIRGKISSIKTNLIILENQGIGYTLHVSRFVADKLLAQMNESQAQEIQLFTHFSVKEDAMTLYGFLAEQDVEIFRLLIGVNGVGPKAALSILSHLSLEELQEAVYSGDSKKISAAQGIGVKTAQKIILDLKDKISKFSPYSHILLKQQETMQEQKNLQEAKDALTSLGYGKKEINFAVGQIDCLSEMTTEEVLKLILERLAK